MYAAINVEQSLAQLKLLGGRNLANAALIVVNEVRLKTGSISKASAMPSVGFEKAEEVFILAARDHLKLKIELPPGWSAQEQLSGTGEKPGSASTCP